MQLTPRYRAASLIIPLNPYAFTVWLELRLVDRNHDLTPSHDSYFQFYFSFHSTILM